jgi:hypothetical protein
MKKYVLMNKETGKFLPYECNLEDAKVFTSDFIDYVSQKEKLIEVYTKQITCQILLTSWKYERQEYVVMDYISGKFFTDVGKYNTSPNLQEAFIFNSIQSYPGSTVRIPVIKHTVVEIV